MSNYYIPTSQPSGTEQHSYILSPQPGDSQPEQQSEMIFTSHEQLPYMTVVEPAYLDENAQWAQVHADSSGLEYFHPYPMMPPSIHQSIELGSTSYGSPNELPGLASHDSGRQISLAALSTARSSRSPSPHPPDLFRYGHLNDDQRTWRCAYPGCNSRAVFIRPCDLRKHFHRHSKNYFCRHEGCSQATSGGFSSRKDRLRHEAKHNPGIECEWEGCERIFSRVDNMKDHMKRIHYKGV